MVQTFSLQLATDTLSIDAQQLGVSPQQLQHIKVKVIATIVQYSEPCLSLTYQIQLPYTSLANQLNWPTWKQNQVGFTDYLWEHTCLECFIASPTSDKSPNTNVSTGYVEINASPNGHYALYQFDDYRSPATLPPRPLLQADKSQRAYISWSNISEKLHPIKTFKLGSIYNSTIIHTDLSTLIFTPRYRYQRSFSTPLSQLPINTTPLNTSDNVGLLHPCVILWFGEVALYFAPFHASPPDFHQHRYWTPFKFKP